MDDDLSPSAHYYDPISLTNNPREHAPWRDHPLNNNNSFLHFSNTGAGADSTEESASLRSHPSRSSHADQALLPRSQAAAPPTTTTSIARTKTRSQPQRLQRRRSHYYYYVDGVLVPATALFAQLESQGQGQVPLTGGMEVTGLSTATLPPILGAAVTTTTAEDSSSSHPSFPPQPSPEIITTTSTTASSPHHKRAKSYGAVGTAASAWLLSNNSSILSDSTKRSTWTSERRESRKLQKDHPVGSARPAFGVALSDGPPDMDRNNGNDGGGGAGLGGSGGTLSRASSVLGVRRKMERLKKGLYRRGSKEAVIAPGLR